MKIIFRIILFAIIAFPVNAQTEKHTKEKIVAEIKEYYKMKNFIYVNGANTEDFEGKSYKNFIVEFSNDNSIMTFCYDYQYEYNSLMTDVKDIYIIKNKIVIDFSTIESITLKTVNSLDENKQLFVLNFKSEPNNAIEKYVSEKDQNLPEIPEKVTADIIPLSANCCPKEAVDIINNKILLAFNELIKLLQTN
ncbi:hypothetical protein [Flavobacterium sp. 245]|uniref:hypothetical protein n=1 Tax=Flavobacterium sp. 245 TaxID=2512115 RepID=UPI00105E064D|nr:hypothetical protein [Flavobacterium sp. 245]TDP00710.1 hypothetical protein EV145_10589 [Flavobacterium sp. 245]